MPIETLEYVNAAWIWAAIGAVLLMAEILAPGAFLLWLGVAAVLVALTLVAGPMSLVLQVALFAALSVLLGLFARLVLRYGVTVSDRGVLNRATDRFNGQVVEVAEPIVNGRGKVKIGDSLWNVEGPDAALGGRVRVTGAKGAVLTVEAA